MGGRIWAQSAPGQGSAFHFTFSAEASSRPDRARLFRTDPSLVGERLLIVDDNATMRELLSRHVELWGMQPQAVSSARSSLHRSKMTRVTRSRRLPRPTSWYPKGLP